MSLFQPQPHLLTPPPLSGVVNNLVSHDHLVSDEAQDIIRRGWWQSARSTEAIAPHEYVVLGWSKDDLSEADFWLLANTIKRHGRAEVWTPPPEWVNRWGGRPMRNTYLYLGEGDQQYAYWLTRGRKAMLNRERVAQQLVTPTRRVSPDGP